MTHTLTALCTHEEDVKKSRFLAYAGPVASVAEAMAWCTPREFRRARRGARAGSNEDRGRCC